MLFIIEVLNLNIMPIIIVIGHRLDQADGIRPWERERGRE